CEGLRGAYW
nr:immunoglobulin heavy chain junction region [Mus musculus]NSM06804.1 immunoglobulin heavy chain junction region [Mus musculus]